MHKEAKTRVLYTLLGMIGGFVLLHPYTMMVYALMHVREEAGGVHLDSGGITVRGIMAFNSAMFPMASAFVILGGLIGLLVALVIERKRKILLLEVENEKNKIAIQTLKEVTVTIAHHLLNANTIIGGKVRQCRRLTSDKKILKVLEGAIQLIKYHTRRNYVAYISHRKRTLGHAISLNIKVSL